MNRYIRVEDGVYAFVDFSITENMRCLNHYGYRNKSGCGILGTLKDFKEYKQADTIEELMRVGDLVFKESGDIFVIQNQAQIDFYIKYKSVYKLFIEDSNGNYIKVAQKETLEGDLELL